MSASGLNRVYIECEQNTAFYQLKVDTDIRRGNRTKAVTHHTHDACVHTSEAKGNVSILRTEANGKSIAHH